MELKIKKPFDWAHQGVAVKSYVEGQIVDTDEQDFVDVTTAQGWAIVINETQANQTSPENKAHKTSFKDKIKKS